jgi:hypothetical protein
LLEVVVAGVFVLEGVWGIGFCCGCGGQGFRMWGFSGFMGLFVRGYLLRGFFD